jgi:predicted phage terminase large subunit-like protein
MDPDFFTPGKWHLKLLAKYMQKLSVLEIMKLLISEPPRAGKSYEVSLFHSWIIGKFPSDSSMRNSYAAELAEKFSYDIRAIIQKPKYLKVFPHVRLKQDRTAVNDWAIETARDSTYFCAGVGGSILGKGCKRIATLDDPIKNIETALSESVLDSVWNWYTSTHLSRFESGCAEMHVATRWSKRDPIGRLTAEMNLVQIEPFVYQCGDTVVIKIPALIDGKSFCEEIHTTEEYMAIKKITEDFIWEAEYMQNPIESKGLLFPIEELNRFSLKEIQGKRFDAIVGFTDTADEGTDYLCSPVGKKMGEKTYITDVVFTQDPIEITEPLVAQQIIDTKCEVEKVESNSGGKSFAINIRKLIKGKSTCAVIFEPQTANKETRILMNAGYIKENFYFRNDYTPGSDYDQYMRYLTSYMRLGRNKKDDAPDATTSLAEYMKLLTSPISKKEMPIGYHTIDELQDKGFKPYEIREIMKKMNKSWEKAV